MAQGLNQFRDWICYTGAESLYIDFDGNVWIGNCAGGVGKHLLREGQQAWGHLGTIHQQFALPQTPVLCPYRGCGCGSDIVVRKHRDFTPRVMEFMKNPPLSVDVPLAEKEITALRLRHPIAHQVLWDVGRRCNYDCSYCWPDVHNTTDPHRTLAEFQTVADYLIQSWSGGGEIRWYFGGGEPTLNPSFLEFVQYLRSRNQWVMLVSNGTQGQRYWRERSSDYDILIFSAHFEQLKPRVFLANVSQVLANMAQAPRPRQHIIKLMTPPQGVAASQELADQIRALPEYSTVKHRTEITMVPLRGYQGYDLRPYPESVVEQIVQFNQGS